MALLSAAAVSCWIEQALADPWDGRCRHLLTVNPEYVVRSRRDRRFAQAVAAGDLRVADGIGIVYAAWLLAGRRAEPLQRVTGVDVIEALVAADQRNPGIFLLGARAGSGEKAARRLMSRHPAAQVAGWWSGGTASARDDAETLERMARSGARVVCVAYGAPDQVIWIDRQREALAAMGVRMAVGVGGAVDVLAGVVPRAPRWMRRVGLEWLYRLCREPWRWRRQLALPWFVVLVLGQRLGLPRRRPPDG